MGNFDGHVEKNGGELGFGGKALSTEIRRKWGLVGLKVDNLNSIQDIWRKQLNIGWYLLIW